MTLLQDDKAQAGVIVMFLAGIFIIGVLYVAIGPTMSNIQDTNNALISDSSMHYTQAHEDSMVSLFDFFWAYPIYVIILFAIYAIVRAMRKEPGEV